MIYIRKTHREPQEEYIDGSMIGENRLDLKYRKGES